jgi:hypothetical protein
LFCFLIASFTITKTELMDIRVAISRSVAYGAAIVTILLLGLEIIYVNTAFIPNNFILQFMTVAVFALIAIAIFEPIINLVQTPIEEKWITGLYKPEVLLNNIAKGLVAVAAALPILA